MSRLKFAAIALLLCLACDHAPLQPPPPPPSQPPPKANQSPVAHISGPTAVREGQNFLLSAEGSSDPEGRPLAFFWAFGDGRSIEQHDPGPLWDGYMDEGLYTVTLVVRDDAGASDTATARITVTNSAPEIVSISSPTQQAVGMAATTRIAFRDAGYADTLVVAIQWGDGKADSITRVLPPWSPLSLTHRYGTAGLFHVSATVHDNDGGAGAVTADTGIVVFDPAERKTIAGYEVLDLGTLGGNDARPRDINDRGQVVGYSRTDSRATRGFLWDGTLRDVGTLGYRNSNAAVINEAGVIAGELWTQTDDYYPQPTVAATWQGGAWRVLAGTQPRPPVLINAIDESGTIAVSEFHSEAGVGWLWRNGDWHRLEDFLPDVSGYESYPIAINARGQVVGAAPYRLFETGRLNHAALWADGTVGDLGVLAPDPCERETGDCSRSEARGINDAGQIVGFSTDAAGSPHFVAWEDGKIIDLGPARSALSFQDARVFINAHGQIAASAGAEGFFWGAAKSARTAIPAPNGGVNIAGLNENGDVVGSFLTGTGEQHVFIWSQSRGMVDLGTGPHGFSCAWAVGINARGDIIGFAAPCDVHTTIFTDRIEARPILWRRQS